MKQIAFFIMLVSYATVVSSSPDITFHGNLIAPPTCIVSENKTIEIAFNEVIISDISGDNYKREVPYSVECDSENTDTGIQMKLTWTGVETDFNDSAVETDVVGLGVELQQNGQRFQQGKAINISKTNLPKLHAVLVKKSGAVLSEGAFEAYATLQVDSNDKKPNLLHQIYSGEFTGASVVSSRNSDEREKQPSFHRKFD